jgi:predicted transcriptional regulator
MTNLRELLAFNIREKRHALGFSQAKLAEKANTAPTYPILL